MSASDLLIALAGVALGAVLFGVVRSRLAGGESGATLALAHSRAQRLHRLAAALSRAASPGDVAGAFLDQAVEQLDAQGGSLTLLSADGLALELVAGRDLPGAEARLLDRIPVDQHFSVTAAYRTGEPAFARNFEELRSRFRQREHLRPEAQAVYTLPLWVGGRRQAHRSVVQPRPRSRQSGADSSRRWRAGSAGRALERALLLSGRSPGARARGGGDPLRDQPVSLGIRLGRIR